MIQGAYWSKQYKAGINGFSTNSSSKIFWCISGRIPRYSRYISSSVALTHRDTRTFVYGWCKMYETNSRTQERNVRSLGHSTVSFLLLQGLDDSSGATFGPRIMRFMLRDYVVYIGHHPLTPCSNLMLSRCQGQPNTMSHPFAVLQTWFSGWGIILNAKTQFHGRYMYIQRFNAIIFRAKTLWPNTHWILLLLKNILWLIRCKTDRLFIFYLKHKTLVKDTCALQVSKQSWSGLLSLGEVRPSFFR